jgi:hypothetical protein
MIKLFKHEKYTECSKYFWLAFGKSKKVELDKSRR